MNNKLNQYFAFMLVLSFHNSNCDMFYAVKLKIPIPSIILQGML